MSARAARCSHGSYNRFIAIPREAHADFPADPSSAGQARRFVDATLRSWRCERLVDIATLLVSELVANSVLHAGTTIAVAVRVDGGRVRVEVHDGNTRVPARKHYSKLATTGRGLLLVERMSDDWGVATTRSGKQVWFELDQRGQGREADFDVGVIDFDEIEPLDGPGGVSGGGSSGGRRGGGSAGPRLWVLAGVGSR